MTNFYAKSIETVYLYDVLRRFTYLNNLGKTKDCYSFKYSLKIYEYNNKIKQEIL